MKTSGQSGGTLAAVGSVVTEGRVGVAAAREGCGSLRGCWGVTTIGFSGSGHIGSQLARLAVAQGYDVMMSNSRGPASVAALVAEFGPTHGPRPRLRKLTSPNSTPRRSGRPRLSMALPDCATGTHPTTPNAQCRSEVGQRHR